MESLEPLAPAARWLFHLQALARLVLFWLPAVTFGVVLGALFWDAVPSIVLGGSFLFVQFVLALWWPYLTWQRWGWALSDEELVIARGVLFRSLTAIPVGRVQHVDVRQGPIEQALGLARVIVHTASGLGGDGIVPGLEAADAEALRDRLVARTARSDDGV
jgi:membrane protein YdbS with pleckstrin-like domain